MANIKNKDIILAEVKYTEEELNFIMEETKEETNDGK